MADAQEREACAGYGAFEAVLLGEAGRWRGRREFLEEPVVRVEDTHGMGVRLTRRTGVMSPDRLVRR
ncbi:hypothetical protein GCM10009549_02090 [Streptomyces thermoalcalitolerans]|uniref:Uncharacterized protein n=1 Tax=Streptomyces thermoalcalitolerans TaxID=65605 RepID=A0ABN1NBV9_9ACTN